MKRLNTFDKSAMLLGLIVLTVLVSALLLYLQVRTDKVTETIQAKQPLAVLFVLHDGDELVFSEVFLYHPATYAGAVLDVPGNLGLIIESMNRFDRVDVLYKPGNLKAFREKLEQFSGLSIPFYIEMSLDGLEHSVDLVEGLELFIANPVERLEGGSPVLLPSGSVVLDGAKIRSFIMYEDPAEIRADSINRRQRLLQSLLKAFGQHAEFLMHQEVFPYLRENLGTNMDPGALRAFVTELYKLDSERILFHHVLGAERNVDGQVLLFPHYEGALFKNRIAQILDSLGSSEKTQADELAVTIQILNGTNVSGLASRTATLFQSYGFDDSMVGNADRADYEQTIVIDRRGNVAAAQRVADIIRCTRVESIPDETLDTRVDVTIILGKDFNGRYCK
jgi:hypothetical protein